MSVNIYFTYLGTPILRNIYLQILCTLLVLIHLSLFFEFAKKFIWVFQELFGNFLCVLLLLIIDSVLKSILSDMTIATLLFISIYTGYLFPIPHFQSVCTKSLQVWNESVVGNIEMNLINPVSHCMSFDEIFHSYA